MTKLEFLLEMDNVLDLPPGTLRGHEKLDDLNNWDSTALITMMVLAENNNNVHISPVEIVTCSTVADLLRLAQVNGI